MSTDKTGSGPNVPDDQQLSAWLDGGLDDDGNAKMADLAARNEDVASRAARLRHMDELVRAAVPAEEEIPAELLTRLGLAPVPGEVATGSAAEVIDLASARAAREARAAARPRPARFAGFGRIAAQLVLISGLGLGVVIALGQNHKAAAPADNAAYRVLGDSAAPAPAANALVRFAPGVDAAEAGALTQAAGATMVGAPSAAGTARLAIDPERRDAVLAKLRATSGVVLAEPLDGGRP